jgi:hypothetical protein
MFTPYDVLSRVHASPEEHIGRPCYANLCAFLMGYQLIPSNDIVWLDFCKWVKGREVDDVLLNRQFTFESYDAFLCEFDACLNRAGKDAHDPAKWPFRPLVQESISSKRLWLDRFRKRPAMYFGPDAKLEQLWACLAGYDRSISDLGQQPDSLNLDDFEEWLRVLLELARRDRWDRMVESICNGRPFECFFALLDHYLETGDRSHSALNMA